MILPNEHLPQEQSLIGFGAEIILQLDRPQTVSELWERVSLSCERWAPSFEWFVLALCFLYTIGAISYDDEVLSRGREASKKDQKQRGKKRLRGGRSIRRNPSPV